MNKKIQFLADNAWLGIQNFDDIDFSTGPLVDIVDRDDPLITAKNLVRLFRQPKNLQLFVSMIYGIKLLPIQVAMLQEIWGRPFPMLIASRGFGKSFLLALYAHIRCLLGDSMKIVVVGSGFRQSKLILEYMEAIWRNAPVLRDICDRDSGLSRDTDRYTFKINKSTVVGVPIGDGCLGKSMQITYGDSIGDMSTYHIDHNNQINYIPRNIKCLDRFNKSNESYYNGRKELFELTTNKGYRLECTSNHKIKVLRNHEIIWSELQNIQPDDRILIDRSIQWHSGESLLKEDDGYLCGLLIGDGSWTNKYKLQFTSKDQELIDFVKSIFPELVTYDNVHYFVHSKDTLNVVLDQFGLAVKCYTLNKTIPNKILNSSKNTVRACLQGLFDTDGTLQVSHAKGGTSVSVSFTNTSQRLVEQMQYLLLHFGIISRVTSRQRKNSKWNRVYELLITGDNARKFAMFVGFRLSRKQKALMCAIESQVRAISYDDQISGLMARLKPTLKKHKLLSKYAHNIKELSYSSACEIYKLLQDKEDLSWLDSILNDDIFYDKVKSIESIGFHDCYDACIESDDHQYTANGFIVHNSKIRGLRAHIIIADEFNSIRPDIYETVISGFASVSKEPIENVRKVAKRNMLAQHGLLTAEYAELLAVEGNQAIISGTAGFDFEHFADYWKRYKRIVESDGDPEIIEDIFRGEVPDNFDHRHYAVIRIPYEIIPEGFMDDKQVSRARAVIDNGTYLNEYGACHINENELILTNQGLKEYREIKVGDKVLSHKGKWRKVVKKTHRNYSGKVYRLLTEGCNIPAYITSDHPFWIEGDSFDTLDKLSTCSMVKPNELSHKTQVDLAHYVKQGSSCIYDQHIYTRYPAQKIGQPHITNVIELNKQGYSKVDIAKNIGIDYYRVDGILKNNKHRKKCSITRNVEVDYSLGKLIGYYAAEGSIGAGGRQVQFAFDRNETEFIDDVQNLLKVVFGIHSNIYYSKSDNGCNICVNSRVLGDVLERMCPGNCYSKFVQPDILFSNKDFMRGFIVGFWNGDGCVHKNILAAAQITSVKLLSQVRTVLSYFNIFSKFHKVNKGCVGIIKGQVVQYSDTYRLNIGSYELDLFMSEFYDIEKPIDHKRRMNAINQADRFVTKIESLDTLDHDGLVYNLEIEKDESYTICNQTVHNCFSKDSTGFFKRSLIEGCTTSDQKPIRDVWFDAATVGSQKLRYVFGIDPASERDNFSIVVLELHPDHHRVVYCWTTTRKEHLRMIEKGYTTENNFYAYCARKIRSLMTQFPCVRIGMDAEGGGRAVSEALHDTDKIKEGEQLIWPIIDPDKEADSDYKAGLHLIELIKFADAQWVSEANHGLKKDMEDKVLLYPRFDNLALGLAYEIDSMDRPEDVGVDFLENCIYEIEELKNELCTIVHTKTDIAGRDRWDTPEIKTQTGKKSRLRKDRYSALLIANMLARQINRADAPLSFGLMGKAVTPRNTSKINKKDRVGNNLYEVPWGTFKAIRR